MRRHPVTPSTLRIPPQTMAELVFADTVVAEPDVVVVNWESDSDVSVEMVPVAVTRAKTVEIDARIMADVARALDLIRAS